MSDISDSFVPTTRNMFMGPNSPYSIKDVVLSRKILACFGPMFHTLDVSTTLQLPAAIAPILNTLDNDSKVTYETIKTGIVNYILILTLVPYIITNYDVSSPVSKDRNLSVADIMSNFSSQINSLTDVVVLSTCNYVQKYASASLTDNTNKELATRIQLQNVFVDLLTCGTFNPALINTQGTQVIGGILMATDYAFDNIYTNVSPSLSVNQIIDWCIKNFNEYIQPTMLHYLAVNSVPFYNVSIPVTPLVLPPSSDPLVNKYINYSGGDIPSSSSGEFVVFAFVTNAWNELIGGIIINPNGSISAA